MQYRSALLPWFASTVLLAPLLQAQESDRPVETLSNVLEMGSEKLLAKYSGAETAANYAANLYATAKQLETEHALAQKNLGEVIVLGFYRRQISASRCSVYTLAGFVAGGGTLYSHQCSRDAVEVEDFLAGLAKRMPLAEGKGDPTATRQIDDAIALIRTLKPYINEDYADDRKTERKQRMAGKIKEAAQCWENLKSMISTMPADDAKAVAAFATASLSWLKE